MFVTFKCFWKKKLFVWPR